MANSQKEITLNTQGIEFARKGQHEEASELIN
jgi:hypothetical protein